MMPPADGCLDVMALATGDDETSGGRLLCVSLSGDDGMLEMTPPTIEVPSTVSTQISSCLLFILLLLSLFSIFLLGLGMPGICGGCRRVSVGDEEGLQ